jgi:hypothetical protein
MKWFEVPDIRGHLEDNKIALAGDSDGRFHAGYMMRVSNIGLFPNLTDQVVFKTSLKVAKDGDPSRCIESRSLAVSLSRLAAKNAWHLPSAT